MTVFIIMATLLLFAVLAALIAPLVRNRRQTPAPAPALASNARVYGEQLAELDAELESGAITPDQWTASRNEIERRVLEEENATPATSGGKSPIMAVVLGVTIPLLAVALYALVGTPAALSPAARDTQDAAHSVTLEQINAMIGRLAEKLDANPQDTDGWIMLGRSNAALGRYQDAANAYAKASAQRPRDASLLADYADILGMANGRNLSGEPSAILARALKVDPDNVKALALSGTAAFERKDYRIAVRQWQKAADLVQEDSEFRQSLLGSIAEARGHLGQNVATTSAAAPASTANSPSRNSAQGAVIQGTVRLSAAMAKSANPDDTVYVFARAAQGPRMPLAVIRRKVSELPFSFSLDDTMAMTPDLKLSGFPQVVVVARISASGLANPQKGELEAVSNPVPPTSKGVTLEIAKARD